MRLGDLDLDPTMNDEATPINYLVIRIIRHAEYDGLKFINDIALLKLNASVHFTGKSFYYLLLVWLLFFYISTN